MKDGVNRRGFLKYTSLSGAFALFEKSKVYEARRLVPYLIPPDTITPGKSSWFATVCRECPAGCGMHVRNREGRAVKAEGNPVHPVNSGKLCARGQSAMQGLYNPDRVREPLLRGPDGKFDPITWDEAESKLVEKLKGSGGGPGDRLALMTPLITGSLHKLTGEWLEAVGGGRHFIYEPFAYEVLRTANEQTFGADDLPAYRIDKAKMLISFGAEFIDNWISPVEYSRDFSRMHEYRLDGIRQFISVEPRFSLTAANADEWLEVKPEMEAAVAMGMVNVILKERLHSFLRIDELRKLEKVAYPFNLQEVESVTGVSRDTVVRLARAFAGASPGLALGPSMTTSGGNGLDTAIAVNLLNYVCGNIGDTVVFGQDSALSRTSKYRQIKELTSSMQNEEVDVLLTSNVNPAYSLPSDAGFEEALNKVPFKVALSSFMDETSALADLILPETTPLEEWGDYSPRKGIVGLMQPTMMQLFDAKSLGDLMLSTGRKLDETKAKQPEWKGFYDYLQGYWKILNNDFAPLQDFQSFWEASLRRGGVWRESKGQPVSLTGKVSPALINMEAQAHGTGGGHGTDNGHGGKAVSYPLITYPGAMFDGRGANKSWLQELPDPLHKITWDSWIELNPQTARSLKIEGGDLVAVESGNGKITLPALIVESAPAGLLAIPLGQGHSNFGRFADKVGASPMHLISGNPDEATGGLQWVVQNVKLSGTKKHRKLAGIRGYNRQLGRELIQVVRGAARKVTHGAAKHHRAGLPGRTGFYKHHEHPIHNWGMVIDLQKCNGCSACVVACYAENNIGIVGRKQIMKGREQSWLNVQNYDGPTGDGGKGMRFIPVMCQQCHNAPCEPVCPVYAAYHTSEGLNGQVYNRCVGTRYCANNCPYKARRFNWFEWEWPEPLNWQLNPDVTVRSKGVMEKCTFCVQRISEGKNNAKDEGRSVRDGEINPACAQTCPAGAITFGDMKDPESKVSKLARDERKYRVLEELNTDPAVIYLKKVL